MAMTPPKEPKKFTVRKAKPLTENRMYNTAVFYLQRYASSTAQLRQVLQRKIIRATMRGEEIPPGAPSWIDSAVEKCVRLGFVNDRIFAEQKLGELRRQGRSQAFILRSLQMKGIETAVIKELLGDDDDSDLRAAIRLVQRRRLGRDATPEGRQKDLAKLLRAGFGLQAAKAALAGKDGDTEND